MQHDLCSANALPIRMPKAPDFEAEAQAARLREARKNAGFKTATAAILRHGFTPSTYLAHENGQNGLRPPAAARYGAAYGVKASWLLTGEGERSDINKQSDSVPSAFTNQSIKSVPTNSTALDFGVMVRDLPVLGIGGCGGNGSFELSGQTLDYVKRPPRLAGVKDAYALYTEGDSMEFWREHGQLVYIHPNAPVKIGDYVVVQLKPVKPGDAPRGYIKRLVRRTATEIRLLQYNPRKELSIPMSRVASVHKILDWEELLGL